MTGFWRKRADQPRPGNVALSYLEGSEKFHERTRFLVSNLGTTSRSLLVLAGAVAESLVETLAGLALAPKGDASRVATSVFDLFAQVYFGEVHKYLGGDSDTSSLLGDALVFEATGQSAMMAAKNFNPFETKDTRGLHKFLKYRQYLEQTRQSTTESDSKLTAYEIATILSDGPDIVIVYNVQADLALAKHDARCVVREILYGEKPDPEKRKKLKDFLVEMLRGAPDFLKDSEPLDE